MNIRHYIERATVALLLPVVLAGIAPGIASSATIRAADDNLLEGLFQTEIVSIGLERLGYDVGNVLHTTIPAMHVAVGQGDAQFCAVSWDPIQNHFFDKAGGTAKMTRLGALVKGAAQGYLVDKATAEKFGITSIEQFKNPEIAKIFDADGDGKADLAGCPPGWGCERVIQHHMDAYDLRETVNVREGAFMMMAANTVTRYKAGESVLYYTYTPLWMTQVLRPGKEVVWLTVPFTSLPDHTEKQNKEAKTRLPDGRNIGFLVNTIGVVANNEFLETNPAARRWFELVQVPIEDVNRENYLIHKGENTPKEIRRHAEEWVTQHESLMSEWLSEARKAAD